MGVETQHVIQMTIISLIKSYIYIYIYIYVYIYLQAYTQRGDKSDGHTYNDSEQRGLFIRFNLQ